MFKEVKSVGSQQFTGYEKKLHKESEYQKLTGLTKKRQSVPRNILFGMVNKQKKRAEKGEREDREGGVVSHKSGGAKRKKKEEEERQFTKKSKKHNLLNGPSPNSIGFMSGGVLKLKKAF
ncbi:hypothetical protein ScalyP_jg10479 [Parmales sp. scaly parma]|nr:hypothetical protein ScalyP_jg10479 [Parmales sp. scaly parma]